MSQTVRARSMAAIVVMALMSGVIVKAQIGVTPYKVNFNWDKLEGRKIGVPAMRKAGFSRAPAVVRDSWCTSCSDRCFK